MSHVNHNLITVRLMVDSYMTLAVGWSRASVISRISKCSMVDSLVIRGTEL